MLSKLAVADIFSNLSSCKENKTSITLSKTKRNRVKVVCQNEFTGETFKECIGKQAVEPLIPSLAPSKSSIPNDDVREIRRKIDTSRLKKSRPRTSETDNLKALLIPQAIDKATGGDCRASRLVTYKCKCVGSYTLFILFVSH
jgi:hypothetical protein